MENWDIIHALKFSECNKTLEDNAAKEQADKLRLKNKVLASLSASMGAAFLPYVKNGGSFVKTKEPTITIFPMENEIQSKQPTCTAKPTYKIKKVVVDNPGTTAFAEQVLFKSIETDGGKPFKSAEFSFKKYPLVNVKITNFGTGIFDSNSTVTFSPPGAEAKVEIINDAISNIILTNLGNYSINDNITISISGGIGNAKAEAVGGILINVKDGGAGYKDIPNLKFTDGLATGYSVHVIAEIDGLTAVTVPSGVILQNPPAVRVNLHSNDITNTDNAIIVTGKEIINCPDLKSDFATVLHTNLKDKILSAIADSFFLEPKIKTEFLKINFGTPNNIDSVLSYFENILEKTLWVVYENTEEHNSTNLLLLKKALSNTYKIPEPKPITDGISVKFYPSEMPENFEVLKNAFVFAQYLRNETFTLEQKFFLDRNTSYTISECEDDKAKKYSYISEFVNYIVKTKSEIIIDDIAKAKAAMYSVITAMDNNIVYRFDSNILVSNTIQDIKNGNYKDSQVIETLVETLSCILPSTIPNSFQFSVVDNNKVLSYKFFLNPWKLTLPSATIETEEDEPLKETDIKGDDNDFVYITSPIYAGYIFLGSAVYLIYNIDLLKPFSIDFKLKLKWMANLSNKFLSFSDKIENRQSADVVFLQKNKLPEIDTNYLYPNSSFASKYQNAGTGLLSIYGALYENATVLQEFTKIVIFSMQSSICLSLNKSLSILGFIYYFCII
jgi:hypothetical protein